MPSSLFASDSARGGMPDPEGTRRLGEALRTLPPPWRVLSNRRPAAADGPPWVKYLALHPGKGIALLDLRPVDAQAAVAPLEGFMAGSGLATALGGRPPVVALILTERDIPTLPERLAKAFSGQEPCRIALQDWPDQVIDKLTATPGLLLERLVTAAATTAAAAAVAAAAAPRMEPGLKGPRIEPRLGEPPPVFAQEVVEPASSPTPQPSFKPPQDDPPPAPQTTRPRTVEPEVSKPEAIRPEAIRPEAIRPDRPALSAPDPALRFTPRAQAMPSQPSARQFGAVPILVAIALVAALALWLMRGLLTPSIPDGSHPADIQATAQPASPVQVAPAPAAPAVAPSPKPTPPAKTAATPIPMIPPVQPAPPAPVRDATATPSEPVQPAARVPNQVPLLDERPKRRTAIIKPVAPPALVTGPPANVAPAAATDDGAAETVTVGGTTYVKGREPKSLGTLTSSEGGGDQATGAPTPLTPNASPQ